MAKAREGHIIVSDYSAKDLLVSTHCTGQYTSQQAVERQQRRSMEYLFQRYVT